MGLAEALASIRKMHGADAVMVGSPIVSGVKGISTGSLSLDIALGVGGFPRGRITEVFGAESVGKTTLCLEAAVRVQKAGGKVAFIDVEHALDRNYAENGLGIKWDELILAQPASGEEALSIADALVKSEEVDLIIIDSVANLVPQKELEGDVGDVVMGGIARLMSQSLRKMTASISKANCSVVFINQVREKIGLVFGNPQTQPGGRALKFHASCRIELSKLGSIKDKDQIIGSEIKAKVIKNKVSMPFTTAKYSIYYGRGICDEATIYDMAVAQKLIEVNGTHHVVDGQKINGKQNTIAYLEANPEYCSNLREKVLAVSKPVVSEE